MRNEMTTTELIELLKQYEKGASGRSREITIYSPSIGNEDVDYRILKENDRLIFNGSGDGIAGAELTLMIVKGEDF